MSSFRVFLHDDYCLDHGLSIIGYAPKKCAQSGNFQFDIKSPSDPTRLLCQMQANSSIWTILKFMGREWNLLLLVYLLRKTWNLAFSQVVVQLTAKKCTKKRDARAKLLLCLVKLLLIWISHRRRILIVIRQKQNMLGANSIALADSNPNVFFNSSVVPLFLVRKVENKSFPCTHKLGERTGQVWRDNNRRVRTHEKNSGETVRRLGTIIQSIFCAQSGAGIR